jgi:hypothetical protein
MEHEIIGHSKKALKILRTPGKSFWEKAKEILIEILIIVFAVTFAAFIERSRENHKEQDEAKEFVLGLKQDLNREIADLKTGKSEIDNTIANYTMFKNLKASQIDSLKNKSKHISFNVPKITIQLENGRYEGFKSSGKIQTIENDSLRNDILKLYQEDVPYLVFAETQYNDMQKRVDDLILNGADNNKFDILQLLTSEKAKILLQFSIDYVEHGCDGALKQAEKVEAEINKEYQ